MSPQASGCSQGRCAGQAPVLPASINGVALLDADERLSEEALKERAWTELLRQEAVRRGLLPKQHVLRAPAVTPQDQGIIERMLEDMVPVRIPHEEACRRYYEANKQHFVQGRQMHLRHILFAVTDGVDVGKLAAKAQEVLLELTRKDAPTGLFAERARQYSNCPSGANGGDIGWVGPQDCAGELANELFLQENSLQGLRPRLVHTRYGLHIFEVLGRKDGKQLSFDEARPRIAMLLAAQSRATAMHQYIRLLAGRSRVEGLDLEAAHSPLVQ